MATGNGKALNQEEMSSEQGFTSEMVDILKKGCTGFAIVIGHRLGLIQDLSKRESTATVEEIAKTTGLKERYVKEWCALMATGGILEVTPDGERYLLPVWKRGPLLGNNIVAMHSLFMLNALPNCTGAKHMQKMAGVMKAEGPSGLEFEPDSASEDGMYNMSMELEIQQMSAMIESDSELLSQLEAGITTLELGCNAGILQNELGRRFPASNFWGVDIAASQIAKAQKSSLNNNKYFVHDITELPPDWSEKFDYVFAFKVIHDVDKPRDALKQAWKILKKGGKFSLFEYDVSSNPAENLDNQLVSSIYFGSLMYCIPYSIGLNNGASLGAAWGVSPMKSYLQEAGFNNVHQIECKTSLYAHIVGYK